MIVVKRRYDFAPLAALMGMSEHQAAITLGISGTTEQQYRTVGMSEKVADRLAVKAGHHPHEAWPEMASHATEDASRPCEECSAPFLPGRSDQRYCSKECRWRRGSRENFRRRYRNDPAFRAAQLERSATYQADPKVADVRRRKERARYAARG